MRHHLGAIVGDALACRRNGYEEARVEALHAADGRQPVAEIFEVVDGQAHPTFGAKLDQCPIAAMQRTAPCLQRRDGSGRQRRAVRADGEQEPRLFEAFANRGHHIVQPAGVHGKPRAGRDIIAGRASMRVTVALVDDPAGKHPGATVVVATLGSQQQQYFHAAGCVAHDDKCRRGPRWTRRRRNTGRTGWGSGRGHGCGLQDAGDARLCAASRRSNRVRVPAKIGSFICPPATK